VTLAEFFAAIGPVLEGKAAVAESVRALYAGEPERARDAERVAIYARMCRIHRFEVLDQVYVALRRAVIARGGEAAWEELVETFFRAHPMRHVELNENGAAFPGFVAERAEAGGLPGWMAELADLEWWEWKVRVQPDDPADADGAGPLRIASTVELRPYGHDLTGWLDEHAPEDRPAQPQAAARGTGLAAAREVPQAAARGTGLAAAHEEPQAAARGTGFAAAREVPQAGETVVLFWRDRELDPRREPATAVELATLKLVDERRADAAGARAIGLDPRLLDETIDDLWAAGVLVGARS
jgi:hypothetical protein